MDPTLERLQQFVADGLQNVMRLDCLESSHPISVLVNHPDEIGELFDDISYKKGMYLNLLQAFNLFYLLQPIPIFNVYIMLDI